MKHLAAEILDALDLRCRGAVELTAGRDQRPCMPFLAVSRGDFPKAAGTIELGRHDFLMEAQVRGEPVLAHAIFHVLANFHLQAELARPVVLGRSEEHTSELQSLMRISYAVFCLKKKNKPHSAS